MRLGRLALLAGFVAVLAVAALAWARTRLPAAPELPESTAEATSAGAAQPAGPAQPRAAGQPAVAAPAAPPPAYAPPPNVRPPGSPELAAADRIDALVQAGDIGRARDAAEEFLRRYPYSSYCQHIETLTGVHPRPALPGE